MAVFIALLQAINVGGTGKVSMQELKSACEQVGLERVSSYIASGKADAWIEAQAKPWDLAPLKIIVEEAGAVTFDFAGQDTIYGGNYVITVPGLAEDLRLFVGRPGDK